MTNRSGCQSPTARVTVQLNRLFALELAFINYIGISCFCYLFRRYELQDFNAIYTLYKHSVYDAEVSQAKTEFFRMS